MTDISQPTGRKPVGCATQPPASRAQCRQKPSPYFIFVGQTYRLLFPLHQPWGRHGRGMGGVGAVGGVKRGKLCQNLGTLTKFIIF